MHLRLTSNVEIRDEVVDGLMAALNFVRDVVLEEELFDRGRVSPRFHALFYLFQQSERR